MDFRKLGLGLATFAGGVAAITVAAVALGRRSTGKVPGEGKLQALPAAAIDGPAPAYEQRRDRAALGDEGHAAPDLTAGAEPVERAPAAFRPDMDAPMTPAEREALRPVPGPSPTLVDAGTSQPV